MNFTHKNIKLHKYSQFNEKEIAEASYFQIESTVKPRVQTILFFGPTLNNISPIENTRRDLEKLSARFIKS